MNRSVYRVGVWIEQDTEISARNTLSYSVLYIGDDLQVFLGHTPEEVLVAIQRLQDELADLKWRVNTK